MRRTTAVAAAGLLAALLVAPAPPPAEAINIRDAVVAVATSSTVVLAAPTTLRRFVSLQNPADTDVWCRVTGQAAVVGQGVYLKAGGGGVFYDIMVPSGSIACIHGGTGTKDVLVNYE